MILNLFCRCWWVNKFVSRSHLRCESLIETCTDDVTNRIVWINSFILVPKSVRELSSDCAPSREGSETVLVLFMGEWRKGAKP